MQALHRGTSVIEQPDGELMRAIVDPATTLGPDLGIQFRLGMLAQKAYQDHTEEQKLQSASEFGSDDQPGQTCKCSRPC